MDRRTASKLLVVLPACLTSTRRAEPVAPAEPPPPTPPTRPAPNAFDAGPRTDYAPGTATRFRNKRVIVIHDELGVMAVSAVCTHQACLVKVAERSLACACHGSEFTMDGEVLVGPAKEPLPHFAVTTYEGRIHVDPSRRVPKSERLIL